MEEEGYSCPSFSRYSTNKVAEIAAKIADEVKRDSEFNDPNEEEKNTNGEEDFEFSFLCENPDASAGEFFYHRQIKPVFPVFNRDLLLSDVDGESVNDVSFGEVSSEIQIKLKDLFLEEREPPQSSSSSEVDELESVPPGSYCVWKPKVTEPSPSRCTKSNSTGSALKRWKIRDLMRRSNSDGKDSFVFLTSKKGTKNESSKGKHSPEKSKAAGKLKLKGSSGAGEKARASLPASAAVYFRNQTAKEVDKKKRKSYLPYRKDLVGFFVNVNGFGSSFPPF